MGSGWYLIHCVSHHVDPTDYEKVSSEMFFCPSLVKPGGQQATCSKSEETPSKGQGPNLVHSKPGIVLATCLSAMRIFFFTVFSFLQLLIASVHKQWLIFSKQSSMWSPTQKIWLILLCSLRGVAHDIQDLSAGIRGELWQRAGKMPCCLGKQLLLSLLHSARLWVSLQSCYLLLKVPHVGFSWIYLIFSEFNPLFSKCSWKLLNTWVKTHCTLDQRLVFCASSCTVVQWQSSWWLKWERGCVLGDKT